MKTTARHSESPGRDNPAGRGNRDPSPEVEADPKRIRGSSTNPGQAFPPSKHGIDRGQTHQASSVAVSGF